MRLRRPGALRLWNRFDAWVEGAVLHRLSPPQQRAMDYFVTLCSLAGVALAFLVPQTASLTLLLPLFTGCHLRGARRAWLLGPLALLHLLLQGSWLATLLFLVGGTTTILFAVVTAKKFRAVRSRDEELRRSLEVARHVQQALEPPRTSDWGVLEMACRLDCCETLGGDFLCLRPVGPDRFGIMIGDVMGKGVRAALAAAFVTGLYGELAREGFGPSAILEIANRRLCELFGPFDFFVTIAVLEYDPKRSEWRVALAGHEPPLLLRADGHSEELTGSGLPAGIDADEQYRETRRPALQGDQVFMVSDGLIPEGLPVPVVREILQGSSKVPVALALDRVASRLRADLPANRTDDATIFLVRHLEEEAGG